MIGLKSSSDLQARQNRCLKLFDLSLNETEYSKWKSMILYDLGFFLMTFLRKKLNQQNQNRPQILNLNMHLVKHKTLYVHVKMKL